MSEVNVKEVQALNPLDFVCYTNWLMRVRLEYLIAEGFIDVVFDKEGVPSFNCLQPDGTRLLFTETEVEDTLLHMLLEDIGRYV